MESAFRTLLIDWLRSDIQLSACLNAVQEEGPSPAPAPTLSIAASASADWSTKTFMGREVRLALELLDRSDQPETSAAIASRIEPALFACSAARRYQSSACPMSFAAWRCWAMPMRSRFWLWRYCSISAAAIRSWYLRRVVLSKPP